MKQSLIRRLAFLSLCITSFSPLACELFNQSSAKTQEPPKPKPIVSDIAVVAHRGACAYGPENSLAAFRQAIRMHADYIELDVQMTKDGQLIAIHDESLKRTTNAKKLYPRRRPWLVKDFSLKEIRRLDAGSWFNRANKSLARREYIQQHVPTLQEIIRFVQKKGKEKVGLYIETKVPNVYPGLEESLITILQKNDMLHKNNLMFVSLSETSLRKIKTLAPDAKVIQLYSAGMMEGMDVKQEFKRISEYASGVGPNKEMVVPELIDEAHQNGLFVLPWTVNNQDDMDSLLSLGVDGEITNTPDLFANLLDSRKCSEDPECY